MLAEFRKVAPNGLTIQYVGSEPMEGWKALDDMWTQYGNKCPTELVTVLINGNEAATYVLNHMQTDEGVQTAPSIETYTFTDGTLHIRYFHNTRD